MAISLRSAEPADLKFVQQCAANAYEKYVERMGQKPAPMLADFEAHFLRNEIEVIMFDGEPAGYCVSFRKDNDLFIENVALQPTFQGNGLSVSIFEILEARARKLGLEKLKLYTNQKMYENLGLYSKLGFIETERREEDGFHRVFFEKQI